jgi:hypothetical protein
VFVFYGTAIDVLSVWRLFPLVGVGSAGGARRTAAPTRQRSPNERLSRQPWT